MTRVRVARSQLERRRSPAVEVRRLLPVELAAHSAAVLGGAEPLEAVVDQLRVLLVEVLVSHDVGGAGVHLAAAHLRSGERGEWRWQQASRNVGRLAAHTRVSVLVKKAFSVKAHIRGGLRRDGSCVWLTKMLVA